MNYIEYILDLAFFVTPRTSFVNEPVPEPEPDCSFPFSECIYALALFLKCSDFSGTGSGAFTIGGSGTREEHSGAIFLVFLSWDRLI
jgi:hypothetical protein